MSNKRQYKSDSQEFKEEAIALLTEQGYNVPEAAASLDICPNQLYSWKQKQEAAKGDRLLSVDERSEWLALRRENKRLRMEKEILKKASAFFAKEMRLMFQFIKDLSPSYPIRMACRVT